MILACPKSTYRVIAFLLVVALLVCLLPAPAKAVGGLDDLAMAGTIVASVGGAALLAYGVSLVFNNHNTGSVSDFIGGKMQDYCDEFHDGAAFTTVFGDGISYSAKGFLLTGAAILGLTKFCEWFVDKEGLSSSSSTLPSESFYKSTPLGAAHHICPTDSPYYFYDFKLTRIVNPINYQFTFHVYDSSNVAGDEQIRYFLTSESPGYFVVDQEGSYIVFRFYGKSGTSYGFTRFNPYSTPISSSSISATYTPVSDYPVDGSSALAPDHDYELEIVSSSGTPPEEDPELDPLGNLAVNALQLYLAHDAISRLTQASDPSSDPDSGIAADTSTIKEVLSDIGAWIQTTFDNFVEVVTEFITTFWTRFTTAIRTVFDDFINLVSEGWETLTEFLSNFWDNLTSAISEGISSISDKLDDIKEDMPDPADPDDLPTLPFAPSSFSGFGSIWHYVVSWLGYIGGFISLILSVWSSLPYAMVVPVYACITLILIFGIYRKFIA